MTRKIEVQGFINEHLAYLFEELSEWFKKFEADIRHYDTVISFADYGDGEPEYIAAVYYKLETKKQQPTHGKKEA